MLTAMGWVAAFALSQPGVGCPEAERKIDCTDASRVSGAVGKLVTLPCSARVSTAVRIERGGDVQVVGLGAEWVLLLGPRRSEVLSLGGASPAVTPVKIRPRIHNVEAVLRDGENYAVLGKRDTRQQVFIWWFGCDAGCKQRKHTKYLAKPVDKTSLSPSVQAAAAGIVGRWAEGRRIQRCMRSSAGCPELHNENPESAEPFTGGFPPPPPPLPAEVRNRIGVEGGHVYFVGRGSQDRRTLFSDLDNPMGPPTIEITDARAVGGGFLVLLRATRPRAMPLDYGLLLALGPNGEPLGSPMRLISGLATARHDVRLGPCTDRVCALVESEPKGTVVSVVAPEPSCVAPKRRESGSK